MHKQIQFITTCTYAQYLSLHYCLVGLFTDRRWGPMDTKDNNCEGHENVILSSQSMFRRIYLQKKKYVESHCSIAENVHMNREPYGP